MRRKTRAACRLPEGRRAVHFPGVSGRIVYLDAALKPLLDQAGLRAYGDFVDTALGEVVSRSGTTLTRRIDLPASSAGAAAGHSAITVYLKRYRYEGDRWRHRFRRHKAAVEAANYRVLRERCGVLVPDVLAYGARRSGLQLRDAFLLTRGIADTTPMDRLAESLTGSSDCRKAALMQAVADTAAAMHRAHFFHADLQWRNLLIGGWTGATDAASQRGELSVYVIDSSRGGIRRTPPGRRHGRVRDLASLDKLGRACLSQSERLRWLRNYLSLAVATESNAVVARRARRVWVLRVMRYLKTKR